MKVVLVPLDDRPCNMYFPKILPIGKCDLCIVPKRIMGNIKRKAKIDELKLWISQNVVDSDYLILSLDTLIYGGLIPSRLHHSNLEELIFNLEYVKQIKKVNPKIKIFAFQTIMRTPNSNFDSEEPKYYSTYGKKIFKYGVYLNKEKLNNITKDEMCAFNALKEQIPKRVINDYINRRSINLEVLKHTYKLYFDGLFDYFYIPQDDSAPLGFTRIDQIKMKEFMEAYGKLLPNFPGADEVGMVMLARCLNDYHKQEPKVFVHYASCVGSYVIPCFEDRMIDLTINEQIMAMGAQRVYSLLDASIVLAINIGSKILYFPKEEEKIIPYDIDRNLSEFVSFIRYAKSIGKIVGIADVAYPNGADLELFKLLYKEDLLLSIDGYASWNTASNTIGTVLAQISTLHISKDRLSNKKFLIHRYYDDTGYCSYARTWTDINAALARGLTEAKLDGKNGVACQMAKAELMRYMQEEYPSIAKYVKDVRVSSPWNRTFEMQFSIKYNKL